MGFPIGWSGSTLCWRATWLILSATAALISPASTIGTSSHADDNVLVVTDSSIPSGSSSLRRRLNNERVSCPTNSIYHCDNPNFIMDDPTVFCGWNSCQWLVNRFDPDVKPRLCQDISIVNVEDISDFLEPCLLWEMMYGAFVPTGSPTTSPAPTTTAAPSDAPSLSPTSTPKPSNIPSAVPTPPLVYANETILSRRDNMTTSGDSILALNATNTTALTNTTNSTLDDPPPPPPPPHTEAPKDGIDNTSTGEWTYFDDEEDVDPNHTVIFETVLLTYLVPVPPPTTTRRTLHVFTRRDLSSLVAITLDLTELLVLTSEHLLLELRRLADRPDDIQDVRLVVKPVQTQASSSTNEIADGSSFDPNDKSETSEKVEITEAIGGNVVFSPQKVERDGGLMGAELLQERVLLSFEGEALERYLKLLHISSDDPILQSVKAIHLGLPSDLNVDGPSTSSTTTTTTQAGNEQDDSGEKQFEWNVFWISIVAGGGSALLCLCLTSVCMCRRKMSINRHRDLLQTKSTSTMKSSTSGKNSPRDVTEEPTGHDDLYEYDEEASDIDEESRAGRYPQSESTSVYSYIEGHMSMMDDQSFSVAPSMLYGTSQIPGDDQSLVSRMWSVTDGIGFNYDAGPSPDKSNSEFYASALGIAEEEREVEAGRVLIFSDVDVDDGDNDLSMVSEYTVANAAAVDVEQESQQRNTSDCTSPHEKIPNSMIDCTGDDASLVSDAEDSCQQRLPFLKETKSTASIGSTRSVQRLKENYLNKINSHENGSFHTISDDDSSMASSIFQGPSFNPSRSARYSRPSDRGSVLTLAHSDKLDTSSDYILDRVTPLGLSRPKTSRTPQGDSAYSIPQSYAHDEKKEDISGRYPIVSMASF